MSAFCPPRTRTPSVATRKEVRPFQALCPDGPWLVPVRERRHRQPPTDAIFLQSA